VSVETVSDGACDWSRQGNGLPLVCTRAATVHRKKRRRALASEQTRQLINGKRPDHYVRIVFRKSSAIVTVECGAETGVRGWGPASEVVLLSSNMIVAFFMSINLIITCFMPYAEQV
jgi:hypothetical protein